MHIALPITKTNLLLGADTLEMMGHVTENDNRNAIFISAESKEEADLLFNGLSEGGTIEMPINYGPSGNYFGIFAGQFGIQWMVGFNPINN